ncbi:SDR family NAD(P)-dependent oxidoreductase [Acinetobacter calcoaceticus]|uniref:SDR family NAD(P)-dependent oxidoreductase n=1 Tax=Acinetobacter calcoaceticus TaxID=471 RepID=UPI0019013FAB|nr:SDR family NAD(P)-dependent oxidoreductase [Acinetobacter calcoaceticus]MBJ9721157.1 SDR family NAD(P)-dependent oxidoreductase [Acinetobacter calcoaceticus]
MLLNGKVALVFGGSGAIGTAIAQVLIREGAHVYLCARNLDKLQHIAAQLQKSGGVVHTVSVDVLDSQATSEAVGQIAQNTSGLDLVINATSFMHDQGKELLELNLNEFVGGIQPFLTAQFNISKAVVPYMGGERGGTIISIVAPSARMAIPGHLGHIVGCAGIEAFIKALASELGSKNIRVLGVRSHAIVDAVQAGSYTRELFESKAQAMGLSIGQWLEGAAQSTMLKRLPTLSQVAETVAFLASEHANSMTATIVNMTAGAIVD